ncbi:MAG: archease [Candidatus Micrarchaeia archaeon]
MAYKYLTELTSADVAFEATGESLEEMFSYAGIALLGVMVRDPNKIEPKTKYEISKKEINEERLLFSFLDELVFLKDAEQMFFSKFDIKIHRDDEGYMLHANAYGDKIDPKKHDIVIDAKAVTMHHFKVEKIKINGKEMWRCQVIIDV